MESLNVAPQYSFLSQPPSRQKRLMHSPVASPPRYALPDVPTSGQAGRRSSFTAKITAWASFVKPGSPAPVSPDRDPTGNLSRTGEGHHPSVSSSAEAVSPTTASRKTFDFKAVGYNSLFLPMPKTPENMSSMARTRAEKEGHLPKERPDQRSRAGDGKEEKGGMIQRFRSMANLRSCTQPGPEAEALVPLLPSLPISSSNHAAAEQTMPSKPAISKMKSSQSKKSTASKSQKEATYRSLERLPSILASELALMQFADGGKLDDHIQRLMPTQSGVASGVDREGVRSGHAKEVGKGELFAKPQNAEGRFGVKGSSGHTTYPTKVASSRKALPEARHTPLVKPGPMLLSLPSRSSHAADHLKRPKYIVDSRPFTTPMQAGASKSPKSPNGPSHRNTPSIGNKTRKRPAPLKLLPGLQKMRRIVAVSSPGSGVPPLSSRFFGFSRTPAKQGQLLEGGLNREGKMHSAHHGVSYFEDDSEDEFVR